MMTDLDKAQIPGIALNPNPGAEISTAGWATYHNGTTQPSTGMTGGSMTGNITVSRTTTAGEVIAGNASFKIVKAAANAQGDGYATTFTLPALGRAGAITMPIKILSGSMVQGDIKIFCWDNTNGVLITPSFNDVIGSGPITATFPISSNTTSMTCGVHFASTSTTAVTFSFEFLVNAQTPAIGFAGSDWTAYTPTFTGLGTVSNTAFQYRRVGDSIEISGTLTLGTVAASLVSITLPAGLSIDTSKITIGNTTASAGNAVGSYSSGAQNAVGSVVTATATNSALLYLAAQIGSASNGQLIPQNGSAILASSTVLSVSAKVPIAGLSSNVTMGQSSTFRISSYLANGTRVTTTPTALGQYRAYTRAGSTLTYSDNAPTDSPSATNGMHIYRSAAYSTSDTSGQPSKYDIFVGKNKNVKFEWFAGTGRTGSVDVSCFVSGSETYGMRPYYDPTTGIVTIDANFVGAGTTLYLGTLAAGTTTRDAYFDVIVSENALAVGIAAPRSEVLVHTGTGHGSTNTKIRTWGTVAENYGSAISYFSDSVNGDSFKINEDGVYSISYTDRGGSYAGVSVNTTAPTTTITSLTYANGWRGYTQTNSIGMFSRTLNLKTGDVVRAHTDGLQTNNGIDSSFCITKVSN